MSADSTPPATFSGPLAPDRRYNTRTNASDHELDLIAQLRTRVSDILPGASPRWRSDPNLLRVLRARKLDIDAADTMYRNIIAWRAEVGADTILETYKENEVVKRYFGWGFHGYDRDGNPILVERMGTT
jgi:hypothetical protein